MSLSLCACAGCRNGDRRIKMVFKLDIEGG